jgi:Protein kinase domain
VPASADSFFPAPTTAGSPPKSPLANGTGPNNNSKTSNPPAPGTAEKPSPAPPASDEQAAAAQEKPSKKREAYVPPPAIGYETQQAPPSPVESAPRKVESLVSGTGPESSSSDPNNAPGSPPQQQNRGSATKKSSYVPPAPIHTPKSASASTVTPVHTNQTRKVTSSAGKNPAAASATTTDPDHSEEAESLEGSLDTSDDLLVRSKDAIGGGSGSGGAGVGGDDHEIDILSGGDDDDGGHSGGLGIGNSHQEFGGLEFSKGTLDEFNAAVPPTPPAASKKSSSSKASAEGKSLLSGDMATLQISTHSSSSPHHVAPMPNSSSGMRFDELYRLKGVLGTGAFSTVREGFHRANTDISYAVKCVNRKKLSEEDEAALLDEVGILKEMDHVHIIRLYDFFEEPSTYYLVLERMRGGELFDRIVAKAYYNEKEARDTCKILLEAVDYCHSHHIAHRDLKPENLLLLSENDDSAVKIADFGFAKKVYEKNSLTTQCGTPGYVCRREADRV